MTPKDFFSTQKSSTQQKTIFFAVIFLMSFVTSVHAESISVPPHAAVVECRQEFKSVAGRFYQYIIMEADPEVTQTFGSPSSDGLAAVILGENWVRTGVVYLRMGGGVERLVNTVMFFPNRNGDGGSISGREGYRYGSIGTLAGNGVFIEYGTDDEMVNAMFDEIVGCYVL
jgi:hypothetical protein